MDKATGITRPVKGQGKDAIWEELWVGDVIKCRVYITDRAGCYLWINEAVVFWEADYGQYSIKAKYHCDGKDVEGIFALRDVLRRDIEFITKVPRELGNTKDVVLAIVNRLKVLGKFVTDISEHQGEEYINTDTELQSIADTITYDMLADIVSDIADMGIVPKEVINELFVKE